MMKESAEIVEDLKKRLLEGWGREGYLISVVYLQDLIATFDLAFVGYAIYSWRLRLLVIESCS